MSFEYLLFTGIVTDTDIPVRVTHDKLIHAIDLVHRYIGKPYNECCIAIRKHNDEHSPTDDFFVMRQLGPGRPSRMISFANAITFVKNLPVRTSPFTRDQIVAVLEELAGGNMAHLTPEVEAYPEPSAEYYSSEDDYDYSSEDSSEDEASEDQRRKSHKPRSSLADAVVKGVSPRGCRRLADHPASSLYDGGAAAGAGPAPGPVPIPALHPALYFGAYNGASAGGAAGGAPRATSPPSRDVGEFKQLLLSFVIRFRIQAEDGTVVYYQLPVYHSGTEDGEHIIRASTLITLAYSCDIRTAANVSTLDCYRCC